MLQCIKPESLFINLAPYLRRMQLEKFEALLISIWLEQIAFKVYELINTFHIARLQDSCNNESCILLSSFILMVAAHLINFTNGS